MTKKVNKEQPNPTPKDEVHRDKKTVRIGLVHLRKMIKIMFINEIKRRVTLLKPFSVDSPLRMPMPMLMLSKHPLIAVDHLI